MKSSKAIISVTLGTSALLVLLLVLRWSDDRAIVDPASVGWASAGCYYGWSGFDGTESDDELRPVPAQASRQVADDAESTRRGTAGERMLMRNGMLDEPGLTWVARRSTFDTLAAEMRSGGGETGAARRAEFEAIAYAHPSMLAGSVSLDVVECGAVLCVAVLRADDIVVLDDLIRDILMTDTFHIPVVVELPASDVFSDGESRRLVYAHDSTVVGLPPEDGRRTAWRHLIE